MAQERDGSHRYHGFFHCIKKIYYDEGIKSLWKGLLPRLMRIPPGNYIFKYYAIYFYYVRTSYCLDG